MEEGMKMLLFVAFMLLFGVIVASADKMLPIELRTERICEIYRECDDILYCNNQYNNPRLYVCQREFGSIPYEYIVGTPFYETEIREACKKYVRSNDTVHRVCSDVAYEYIYGIKWKQLTIGNAVVDEWVKQG